jgi:hypothetical protein
MREIKLILTNNINYRFDIYNEQQRVYKFDKNESNEEDLKKIVVDINKSQNKIEYLITNEENLFEFFNRNIICEKIEAINAENNSVQFRYIKKKKKENYSYEINLITNLTFFNMTNEEVRNIYRNNMEEILNKYGNIFNINIEELIKGTTYKANNKNDLLNLIYEDLNLILFKQIITSRLCIVFYRLTYFDLDASKPYIGRLFSSHFGKSESFKINLNRNSNGLYFTDLDDKIFRGYKMKPIILKLPNNEFDLKIKIAKKLLKNKVKIEIVAEALNIPIKELSDIIYGMDENKVDKNSLEYLLKDVELPIPTPIKSISQK